MLRRSYGEVNHPSAWTVRPSDGLAALRYLDAKGLTCPCVARSMAIGEPGRISFADFNWSLCRGRRRNDEPSQRSEQHCAYRKLHQAISMMKSAENRLSGELAEPLGAAGCTAFRPTGRYSTPGTQSYHSWIRTFDASSPRQLSKLRCPVSVSGQARLSGRQKVPSRARFPGRWPSRRLVPSKALRPAPSTSRHPVPLTDCTKCRSGPSGAAAMRSRRREEKTQQLTPQEAASGR